MRLSELIALAQALVEEKGDMEIYAQWENPALEWPVLFEVTDLCAHPQTTGEVVDFRAEVVLDAS